MCGGMYQCVEWVIKPCIHRSGTLWVNASVTGNTSNGVILHKYCPFHYCKEEEVDVNLNNPETQCAFAHLGILCGACQPGLSLAIGSAQCLSYSNTFLVLLIPFAIAGLVLVAFIKFLHLTVTVGTINDYLLCQHHWRYSRHFGFQQETRISSQYL